MDPLKFGAERESILVSTLDHPLISSVRLFFNTAPMAQNPSGSGKGPGGQGASWEQLGACRLLAGGEPLLFLKIEELPMVMRHQ